MNSSSDEDADLDIEEMFFRERIALVEARAKVAFHEYELARLAKGHPEVAARLPPYKACTVADLRTDDPAIYAIGDVVGGYLLAHVASHEGIHAVEVILKSGELRLRPLVLGQSLPNGAHGNRTRGKANQLRNQQRFFA